MSADLPPDVRDRAARAAQLSDAGGSWIPVWDSFHDENREYWRAIVDAVAEVLAAEQPDITPTWQELLPSIRGALPTIDEYDADVARNVALSVEMHLEWRARKADREVLALRARVDLLTTALTGLCDVYHVRPLNDLLDGEETVSEDDGPKFAAWANARAVLSATPTDPVPHTCQLPDIATVREPSSFNNRRWDCPVCDARWIAMGRIVGRRSRYEWHQMPVTKTESEA